MIYAGIGARLLPKEMDNDIVYLGTALARDGWTLRSGAAQGADSAFEHGCDIGEGKKEIYLPWENFNGHPSQLYTQPPRADEIAKKYHPAWTKLPPTERHFHSRNVQQVLGEYVFEPCDMIICWTPDGCEDGSTTTRETGGTGQAIRVASGYNIPIFNLKNENSYDRLLDFLANFPYNTTSTNEDEE